jgi:uncharacterized protein with HEPN domain
VERVDACESIEKYIAGITLEQFLADPMRQLAIERLLEIIGEAARRITDGYRQSHLEIPWQDVVGLRHVVAHEYDRINDDEIWAIATGDVPALQAALKALMPPPPPDETM